MLGQIARFMKRGRAEYVLETALKEKGIKFKKNVFIGNFNVDFLIDDNFVVECDGIVHLHPDVASKDSRKIAYLESHGYEVVRIPNNEIYHGVGSVVKMIKLMRKKNNGGV